nr:helix-turn-helix transcriptional regulator [uncultured Dysosmobacter sp.]
MNAVAKNLKRLRKQAGLTQEELAERLHVTRQAVSSWETAKTQPDIETLTALAEALGTDVNGLIYGPRPAGDGYARYQKRYVVCAAACAVLVLAWAVLEVTLAPYLDRLAYTTYHILPKVCYLLTVPPLALFAAGVLLPALASVWADLRLRGTWLRRILTAAGLLLMGWYLLFLFFWVADIPIPAVLRGWWSILRMNRYGLLRLGPVFLSGLCLFLGLNR